MIVGLALCLRVWGSFIGLPFQVQPDEPNKVGTALHLAENGFRHAGNHPGLLYTTLWGIYRAIEPVRTWLEDLRLPGGRSLHSNDGLAARIWVGRLYLDVLSALTVLTCFFIARHMAGVEGGLIAAALAAFSPLSIAAANYLKEDTPLTFWIAVTALCSIRLHLKARPWDAFLAGAAAGFALGSKYPGAFAFSLVGLGLVATIRQATQETGSRRSSTASLAILAAVGSVCAFVVSTPAILVDPLEMLRGARFQADYASTGHHDGISLPLTDTFGLFYIRRSLIPSFGSPALLFAVGGVVSLVRRRAWQALFLCVWGVGYLTMVESLPAKPYPFYSRYVLPVVPAICVATGMGFATAVHWMTHSPRIPWARTRPALVAGACAVLILGTPLWRSIRFVAGMYPDTREIAARWLEDNLPADAILAVTSYGPILEHPRFRVIPLPALEGTRQLLASHTTPVYVLLSNLAVDRFFENPEDNIAKRRLYERVLSDTAHVSVFSTDGAAQFGFYNPSLELRRATTTRAPAEGQRPHAETDLQTH